MRIAFLFNSISKKIIIPVVLLMVISGLVIALLSYQLSSSAIGKVSNKTLSIVSSSLSINLQIWIRSRISELESVASAEVASKALKDGFLAAGARKDVSQRITDLSTNLPFYVEVGLADTTGKYVAVNKAGLVPETEAGLVEEVLKGNVAEQSNGKFLLLMVPVYTKEAVTGYISAKINLEAFSTTYFTPESIGSNTLINMVDETGAIVLSAQGSEFSGVAELSHPVAQFNADSGISKYVIGDEVFITGYQKTHSLRLWITVSISQSEVLAGVVKARHYSLIIATIVIAISSLLLLLLIRAVVRPVQTAKAAFENLSSGQGDLTIRLDVQSNDEISDMALHFNQFADSLHSLILNIRSVARNLAGSTEQISDQSHTNSKTVRQQSSDMDKVATSIDELSNSALDVAESAQQGAAIVKELNNEVANGLTAISETGISINDLASEIEDSHQMVNKLATASNDINAVVGVINGVAEQTNLLALNAAIEAARAGEMGRGFAVVADEVRILAQRTQSSVGEIKNTVDILQEQTKQVQHSFEKSKEDVATSVEKAVCARTVFNTLTESFKQINSANSNIAQASKEQSLVTKEISSHIFQIKNLSGHTSQIASELLNETNSQEQAISSLNALIERFKVDPKAA